MVLASNVETATGVSRSMATEAMTLASLSPMVDDCKVTGPRSSTHASAPKVQA